MKKFITLTWILIATVATAQSSIVQNLYFAPRQGKTRFSANDFEMASHKAFYMYRNGVYRIHTTNAGAWLIRITDIRNDSIYYEHFGAITSYKKDTLFRLHPSEISIISTNLNSFAQMFSTVYLNNYNWYFTNDQQPKIFNNKEVELWTPDSSQLQKVELVQFVQNKSTAYIFLKCNKAFFYNEHATLNCYEGLAMDGPPPYPANRRDVVWFTPSQAREINGLGIGLQTMGLNRDSIRISGLNINADLLTVMLTLYLPFVPRDSTWRLKNLPDTIAYSEAVDKVYGLSLSGGGLIGPGKMYGLAINGLTSMMTVTKGVYITGLYNKVEEFHGVVIAGVGNKSIKGSGLQIGLVNKCKHLRGIQLGLWNVNSKRKLPLINWNFN